MTEVTSGGDTYVKSSTPAKNYSDVRARWVGDGNRVILKMVPGDIEDGAIPSATLSGAVVKATPGSTVTVALLAYNPNLSKVTWNRDQDGGVVSSVSTVVPSLAAGARFDLNIQPLLQLVANGQPCYGFRISSNASTAFRVKPMVSGNGWVMSYEVSLDPEAPSGLSPAAGAIGLAKPYVSWSPTVDQVACQVQVDADGIGAVDWDSGEVVTDASGLDLADTSFPGFTSGQSKVWRVRTKGEAGVWSPWSSWTAAITYRPKPTLVEDNPAAGVIYDPSTTLTAHLSSGTPTWWSVDVLDANQKSIWSSGRGTTPSIAAAIPETVKGKRLLTAGSYFVRFRAADRSDRVASPGDPAYIEKLVPFTFGTSGTVVAPSGLSVSQVGPLSVLNWTRAAAPDAYVVRLDGQIVARLELDDWTQSGTSYSWTAPGLAAPHTPHAWAVQAIQNDVGSAHATVSTSEDFCVPGVTLIRDTGEYVTLEGNAPTWTRVDRRDEYQPVGDRAPISILRAREFRKGTLAGLVYAGVYGESASFRERLAVLQGIESGEWGEVVQVMYHDRVVACRVMDLLVEPIADGWDPKDPTYDVTAALQQVS